MKLLAILLAALSLLPATAATRPNLVWIMADDLGYAELGCYGQKTIHTPNIDRMAAQGMRFTHFYAGATVCAPSRSSLMTGQHHGHTRVRGNASNRANLAVQSLQADDVTVATVLHNAGYKTALIGKWGLGDAGSGQSGLPHLHGFDSFYGYLNQTHAHNHFPAFLWRDQTREALPNIVTAVGTDGGGYATKTLQFSDDLFADESLKFIATHKDQPFFLYWCPVLPHANNERTRALGDGAEVPDYGIYQEKSWPDPDKGQAAMITRLDSHVGRMLGRLDELGLSENTLVIFTSDNGPHDESNHDLARFKPSGPFTGIKRSLTDGGIRVPFIARWTGRIQAGGESAHVGYFPDWFTTAAELANAKTPENLDGISLVPTLLGRPGEQKQHDFLYWEFHEGGFKQAALYQGRWKGIRSGSPDAPLQLFDQQNDPAEQTNVASQHPDIVETINTYLLTARTDIPAWRPVWQAAPKTKP